jgi:hypothetical protein
LGKSATAIAKHADELTNFEVSPGEAFKAGVYVAVQVGGIYAKSKAMKYGKDRVVDYVKQVSGEVKDIYDIVEPWV